MRYHSLFANTKVLFTKFAHLVMTAESHGHLLKDEAFRLHVFGMRVWALTYRAWLFLLRAFLPLLTLKLEPLSVPRTCTFMSGASEGDRIATHLENAKSAILMEGKSDTYQRICGGQKMFVIGCDCRLLPI